MRKNQSFPITLMQWKRHGVPEFVRLLIEKFKNQQLVHLRTWFVNDKGKLCPTKKGVVIPLEQLAPLREALRKAENKSHVERVGFKKFLDENGGVAGCAGQGAKPRAVRPKVRSR